MSTDALSFTVNGREVRRTDVPPTMTLLRFLRDELRLSGTKEGCAEGDCGACTVAILETDAQGAPTYRSVNACLVLLPMVQGRQIFTVEGLGTEKAPHPIQRTLAEKMGSQCGFCTPGIVMSLFEACYRSDLDTPWKVDGQMCGNLCRCTGYRPIREAAEALAGKAPRDSFSAQKEAPRPRSEELRYRHASQRYAAPTSLATLWDVLKAEPSARLVAGGTDLGLDITKRYAAPDSLVSLERVPELRELREEPWGFVVGAGVPLSDVEDFFQQRLVPLGRMLRYFGARQIKNRATLGGNLGTASPIGDLAPVLLALDARLVLASSAGERQVPVDAFFQSYRQTCLRPGEVLLRAEIPRPRPHWRVSSYKVSKRRELDISTVSAAFAVDVAEDGRVRAARLAFGGMAATPARARRLEAALVGQPWTEADVQRQARALLPEDFQPLSDHRGSAKYRARLAENLLCGFVVETAQAPMPALEHPHTATVGRP